MVDKRLEQSRRAGGLAQARRNGRILGASTRWAPRPAAWHMKSPTWPRCPAATNTAGMPLSLLAGDGASSVSTPTRWAAGPRWLPRSPRPGAIEIVLRRQDKARTCLGQLPSHGPRSKLYRVGASTSAVATSPRCSSTRSSTALATQARCHHGPPTQRRVAGLATTLSGIKGMDKLVSAAEGQTAGLHPRPRWPRHPDPQRTRRLNTLRSPQARSCKRAVILDLPLARGLTGDYEFVANVTTVRSRSSLSCQTVKRLVRSDQKLAGEYYSFSAPRG